MSAPIDSEKVGTVTVLRMAHGKANAIDLELLAALSNQLHRLREAPAVVLTGTGTIFSAGVDLFRVVDGGRAYLDRFWDRALADFKAAAESEQGEDR